jgi:omega-6 fatty acid desaturase (delta-12 desaturase)
MMARLFILAHDACHGSLFGRRLINHTIGRLCFLVTLTPFSLWETGHNTIHHGYTNLKGHDFVWVPLSPAEYHHSSPWRRLLERLYRTVPGFGLYYAHEMWWKKLFYPNGSNGGMKRKVYFYDCILVTVYGLLMAALCGITANGLRDAFARLIFGFLLPLAIWNWVMGFTVYLQHTNPSVAWFKDKRSWNFHAGQVEGTVHVRFPRIYEVLMHNIFEHVAHHISVKIPFYNLPEAQRVAEDLYAGDIVIQEFSWKYLVSTVKACQLYDYDTQTWVRFRDVASSLKPTTRQAVYARSAD